MSIKTFYVKLGIISWKMFYMIFFIYKTVRSKTVDVDSLLKF